MVLQTPSGQPDRPQAPPGQNPTWPVGKPPAAASMAEPGRPHRRRRHLTETPPASQPAVRRAACRQVRAGSGQAHSSPKAHRGPWEPRGMVARINLSPTLAIGLGGFWLVPALRSGVDNGKALSKIWSSIVGSTSVPALSSSIKGTSRSLETATSVLSSCQS